MNLDTLRQKLRELGARPEHQARVLRAWTQRASLDTRRQKAEHFLPLALREALPALRAELAGLTRLISTHPAADGSARLLVGLADGQTVESVLLARDGLCVSTQVGCAVGCRFCMTGRDGLLRQLSGGEIVAQVVLARALRPVRRVVFMGMGEPSHNLEQVLSAIDLLGAEGGVGHKNLVFSTVGDRRVFERLPRQRVRPALALSLHSTREDLRAELMPKAPRIPPAELVALAEDYARATGYPIQYQWTLIEGVNDSLDEMAALVELLRGKYAIMNFIPYNRVEALPWRRPPDERCGELAAWLKRHGVLATLRQSAGQEVDGACGQLRARGETTPGAGSVRS